MKGHGVFQGVPFAQYREADDDGVRWVGSHDLKMLKDRGPACFHRRVILGEGREPAKSDAFRIGTAFGLLIGEGEEAYRNGVSIRPETYDSEESKGRGSEKVTTVIKKPWNGNATVCREWEERVAASGKLALSVDDDALVQAMNHAMRQHEDCADFLRAGKSEVTVRTWEDAAPIQGRIDWLALGSGGKPTAICDFKTCDDINGIQRDIFHYGYDQQMALYQHLCQWEMGVLLPTYLLVVEKVYPHRVGCFCLSDAVLERAHRLNQYWIEKVAMFLHADSWPRGDLEGITTVELPHWLTEPQKG